MILRKLCGKSQTMGAVTKHQQKVIKEIKNNSKRALKDLNHYCMTKKKKKPFNFGNRETSEVC